MKVLGICGSPKEEGSTTLYALNEALKAIRKYGLDTKLIELSKYNVSGCIDCDYCKDKVDCSIDDDFTKKLLSLLTKEDIKGIIYASPVYFGGVSAQMKAFIDRCLIFRRNDFMFEDKVAGVITVGKSRQGGQELTAIDLIKNCLIQGMIVVPDSSPTTHFGGLLWSGIHNGIKQDKTGLKTARNLGKKISETVKKLYS